MAKPAPQLTLKGFLSFLLLHELRNRRGAGDDLAGRLGRRRGSPKNPLTPGTIYPTLKKLRRAKFVKYTRFGRKKVYELTPAGTKELGRCYRLFGGYFCGLKAKIRK